MSLIIHIGYHKTGSTALQRWLNLNREYLLSENIVYPEGLSDWLGHPEIPWCFFGNKFAWQDRAYDRKKVMQVFEKIFDMALSKSKLVILSSEEFCRLDFHVDELHELQQWLSSYRPIILGFFRNPSDFLLSRYRHEVQSLGERRSLLDFLKDSNNVASANFYSRTKIWDQYFGGRCIFRDYSDISTSMGIIPEFLRCIGRADLIQAGHYRVESEEVEIQLHPSLIDCYRELAIGKLPPRSEALVCEHLLNVSRILPRVSMQAYANNLGIGEYIEILSNILTVNRIDKHRTLADIL